MSSVLDRIAARIGHEPEAAEPAEGSMSLGRTFMLWLAANMVVTTMLTGTLFVPGIAYPTALMMIVLGTLIGVTVLVLVGTIGTRTGLPTMILSRGAFGRRGGHLPALFNLVVLMGWSWVQALLAGITLNYVVEDFTGFSSPVLFAVLCQTIVVALALLGHAGIQRVEPWLAVVMLIVAAFVFFTAFREFGLSGFLGIPEQPDLGMTAAIALDIVVATAISWTVLSADFNRHAISQRAGVIGTTLGYTASTVTSMTLGATALGYVFLKGGETTSFDPTVILAEFGLPLAVVIFVSVMATNTLVVYGMTMSYENLRPKSNYLRSALVIGLISIAGATWQGILDRFVSFLFLISALFVPVFAIMIVDYWIRRRGRYSARDLVVPRGGAYWYLGGVNPIAVGSFVVGAALAFYWIRVSPLPFGATLPTFAVTFVLYLVLSLAFGSRVTRNNEPVAQDTPADPAERATGMTLRVRRIVDLSHPISADTQVYPGDPVPQLNPATTIDRDGYNVLQVSMGSQTGTHVDAPYHFLADGARIDAMELSMFLGPATVVDVRGLTPRSTISWPQLEPSVSTMPEGAILVLHTGWSQHWRSTAYLDHPFLAQDAAEGIVAAGVRTVAIDAMSVDETAPPGGEPGSFAAHDVLLGAGGAIVENLTNLAAIDFAEPLLSVLPIRLAGADGAPVRAVALQLEWSA